MLERVRALVAEHDGLVPPSVKFERFVESWVGGESWFEQFHELRPISAATRRSYKVRLAPLLRHLGAKRLHTIRSSHIKKAYSELQAQGIGNDRFRRIHYALVRVLNAAMATGLLATNEAQYCLPLAPYTNGTQTTTDALRRKPRKRARTPAESR